ncbi:unnamed protein product, partial [marine sediment metagenome]
IKNECNHAYKLLDHAECLWCENCVEKLIKKLSKKSKITKEWIRGWAKILEDDSPEGKLLLSEVEELLKQMLKEAGVRVA